MIRHVEEDNDKKKDLQANSIPLLGKEEEKEGILSKQPHPALPCLGPQSSRSQSWNHPTLLSPSTKEPVL